MAPAPATVTGEIVSAVNQVLASLTAFLEPTDQLVVRLLHQSDQLKAVDHANAAITRAMVLQLCGNVEGVHDAVRKATNLSHDVLLEKSAVSSLANVGEFAAAYPIWKRAAAPERGYFCSMWQVGLIMGAFSDLCHYLEKAAVMKLEHTIPESLIRQAKHVLDRHPGSEAQLREVIDLAGKVLQRHRLFYVGTEPRILLTGEPYIYFDFVVDVPGEQVAELEMELADQVLSRYSEGPFGFQVGFAAAK